MADAPLRSVGLSGRPLVLDSRASLGPGMGVMGLRGRLRELVSARPRQPAGLWLLALGSQQLDRMGGNAAIQVRLPWRLRQPVRGRWVPSGSEHAVCPPCRCAGYAAISGQGWPGPRWLRSGRRLPPSTLRDRAIRKRAIRAHRGRAVARPRDGRRDSGRLDAGSRNVSPPASRDGRPRASGRRGQGSDAARDSDVNGIAAAPPAPQAVPRYRAPGQAPSRERAVRSREERLRAVMPPRQETAPQQRQAPERPAYVPRRPVAAPAEPTAPQRPDAPRQQDRAMRRAPDDQRRAEPADAAAIRGAAGSRVQT